jgi:hypothetical protein
VGTVTFVPAITVPFVNRSLAGCAWANEFRMNIPDTHAKASFHLEIDKGDDTINKYSRHLTSLQTNSRTHAHFFLGVRFDLRLWLKF